MRGWVPALACTALAVLNRGDGALVAVALGVAYLATRAWRRVPAPGAGGPPWWRRPEVRALAAYAVIAAPWYLFSWAYFGSPAPATLAAKMLQRGVAGTVVFWPGLGFWWNAYTAGNPLYWVLLPLAAVGLLAALIRLPRSTPLLLWAGLYVLGYSLLQVPRYQNYYTPLAPVLLFLALLGARELAEAAAGIVRREAQPLARWALAGGLAVFAVLIGAPLVASWNAEGVVYNRLPQARVEVYEQVAGWLRAGTPATATVGLLEVGTVGYYADRHVIDFYGLIQPDVAQHLGVNDQRWGVIHYQPDYIVALPWWLAAWRGDPWFQATYTPVYTLPVYPRFSPDPVIIFRRKVL